MLYFALRPMSLWPNNTWKASNKSKKPRCESLYQNSFLIAISIAAVTDMHALRWKSMERQSKNWQGVYLDLSCMAIAWSDNANMQNCMPMN